MYKTLVISFILTISHCAMCQVNKLRFKDGRSIEFEMIYDDPEKLPVWNINMYPAGVGATFDMFLGFKLQPQMRIGNKIKLEANIVTPLVKALDGNTQSTFDPIGDYTHTTMDVSAIAGYTIFGWNRNGRKKTNIDYTYTGGMTKVYRAKIPRKARRVFDVCLGLGYTRHPAQFLLGREAESAAGSYKLVDYRSPLFLGGLRYQKSDHFKMKTNNVTRSYFNTKTIFAYFSQCLAPDYDVIRSKEIKYPTFEIEENVTSGFVEPTISTIGYRFGISRQHGIKNSNWTINWTLEYSAISSIRAEASTKDIFMFLGSFGFGICDKKFLKD